jgi:suppressor of fused protein SUFU
MRLRARVRLEPVRVSGGHLAGRLEYFLGLLPPRGAVASPLAALTLYSVREGIAVNHGDTVPADGPLWPGTDMPRFLVLRPIGDVVSPLELPDGMHVEFMQAIPIFETELAFKARHGASELLEYWQESGVAFWNPVRSPEPALS